MGRWRVRIRILTAWKARLLLLLLFGGLAVTAVYSFRRLAQHRTPEVVSIPSAVAPINFLHDVRPILESHCFRCHNSKRERGGLALDSRSALLKGGDSGPVIVPGACEQSLLLAAVRGLGDAPRMPPKGEPLSAGEIDILHRWIAQGAEMPPDETPASAATIKHWAFQTLNPVPLPASKSNWVRNPVDAFLAHEHERAGLTPVPAVASSLLLRRLYLDLIGVPPTHDELQQFLEDHSADAYEKVVERLLANPLYGERWGRHWMDVWRYSDADGRKSAKEIWWSDEHIWRWRDWIVWSLNANKGYDRMIQEMLAGDELAPKNTEALVATGFLARSYFKLDRNVWLNATVEHTSKAFLGLTLNCARCHDHKSDPITQRDYYNFRAIFQPHDIRTEPIPGAKSKSEKLTRVADLHPEQETWIFQRGEPSKPLKNITIHPDVPSVLNAVPFNLQPASGSTGRRLALARWLCDPKHPLTARVAVNHIWMRHFGQPLVENVYDFGSNTPAPRLQPLLDFLAWDFMTHGWDMKRLHLLLVTSSAYRLGGVQAAASTSNALDATTRANVQIDPDNKQFWHIKPRRMESELLRDSLLHLAGALDQTVGGPPQDSSRDTVPARRSLYYRYAREDKLPLLMAFNPASVEECYRRQESVLPQQALMLANGPWLWQIAGRITRSLQAQTAPEAFVEAAFERILCRSATRAEREAALEFLSRQTILAPSASGETSTHTAREYFIHALLQHNDFIEIR